MAIENKLTWEQLKIRATQKKLALQYIDEDQTTYRVFFAENSIIMYCRIFKTDPRNNDQIDFEDNYKSSCNTAIRNEVVSQFEKNDKDLKLAKAKGVVDPNTNIAYAIYKIPGTFGSGNGRWVAGGYAFTSNYNEDDFSTVYVEDTDRNIAWAVALSLDPNAIAPLDDSVIQAMGSIPGIGSFPQYPVVKSYTEEEAGNDAMGWFFWPCAVGNNLPPIGETEVEPIGGYGFIPSGLYLIVKYHSQSSSGNIRVNFWIGKTG